MSWFERNKFKKIRFLVKVRNSLRGKRKKELLTFLFFVFISFCFWTLQWMKESIESDFAIPVRIVNVPKDMLFTSELPKTLNVHVKDKGATIISYYFTRPLPTYDIDFNELIVNKGVATVYPDAIIARLSKKFAVGLQVLSVFPESLTLNFSHGESKVVPVSMVSSITPSNACGLSGIIHYFPSHVTVYGPLAQLASIKQLYTETLTLKGIKDTVNTSIKLKKIDGVRIIPDEIRAIVPVEPFTEKKIEVQVEGIGSPVGYAMRIFPIKVNLICYVAISRYNDVKPADFRVGVDFFSMGKTSKIKYAVKLIKSPSFVSKIRFQPAEVEVLMEEVVQ